MTLILCAKRRICLDFFVYEGEAILSPRFYERENLVTKHEKDDEGEKKEVGKTAAGLWEKSNHLQLEFRNGKDEIERGPTVVHVTSILDLFQQTEEARIDSIPQKENNSCEL